MTSFSTDPMRYTYLWNKYRPALLKLMMDTANQPQQYSLSDHEFKNVHPNEKGGYAFTLRVFQNKAINDVRSSTIAKNLLKILQQSGKATELMNLSIFEFVMDKGFVLNINRENAVKITDEDIVNSRPSPYKAVQRRGYIFENIFDVYSVESVA